MGQNSQDYEHMTDTEKKDMTDTEKKEEFLKIVNAVHKHIPFFQKYWEKFCRMVEDYGEYVEKCRNDPRCKCERDIAERERRADAEKQLLGEMSVLADQLNDARLRGDGKAAKRLKGLLQERNVEIENLNPPEEPPEPGWVLHEYPHFRYLSDAIAMGAVWLPPGPANPILWFGLFGYKHEPALRGPSSEEERLVFDCARLSVVHDIGGELSPGDERIFYRNDKPYQGKFFQRDMFCSDLSKKKLRPLKDLAKVKRAWNDVLPAIKKKPKKPPGTGQKDEPDGKAKGAKRRGRPRVSDDEAKRRQGLKTRWERYRESGPEARKKLFCEDEDINVAELDNVLWWCRRHPG